MTRGTVTADDMDYLRRESLQTVLACTAVGVYLWCVVLFVRRTRFGFPWGGPVLVAIGLIVALSLRKRAPSLAGASLALGLAAASLHGMMLTGMEIAPYMLVVVVSLVGLFFGLRTVVWVTIACGGLALVVGTIRWEFSPLAPELTSPLLVLSVVGILSSLAVRNLYLTLHWAWDRTLAAQNNEEELRDHQAKLVSTLKALDEACQRLDHLNYDLARAREAAEEARIIRQQFVTNVSHELRTPLNVIVAFSEWSCT